MAQQSMNERKVTHAERCAKVLDVLEKSTEPIGPTEIARRIHEEWCCYGGSPLNAQSSAIVPILRKIGAVRHHGGLYTAPAQQDTGDVGDEHC